MSQYLQNVVDVLHVGGPNRRMHRWSARGVQITTNPTCRASKYHYNKKKHAQQTTQKRGYKPVWSLNAPQRWWKLSLRRLHRLLQPKLLLWVDSNQTGSLDRSHGLSHNIQQDLTWTCDCVCVNVALRSLRDCLTLTSQASIKSLLTILYYISYSSFFST